MISIKIMSRKILLLISISFTFISCSFKTINYSHEFITFEKGIDFTNTSGYWLLNTMKLPEHINSNSEEIVYKTFSKWTGDKVTKKIRMVDKKGKNHFFNIPNKPNSKELEFIENTTDYKYIINVYVSEDIDKTISRESEVFIDVYNITDRKLMLSERVIGFLDKVNGNDIGEGFKVDVIPEMMPKLIKKGLKNIEKNSKFH